jgi:DNA-binding NarL/FixJ family response regulator
MTMPNEVRLLTDVKERLDLVINLLGLLVSSDRSITEGARALKMAGLDNKTIAEIMNTTEGTIRTVTSNLRTRTGRRGQ